MRTTFRIVAAAAVFCVAGGAFAQKGETVRIAFMDPLSGPFANVGQNQLKSWQFAAEKLSGKNPAGVKFEVVGFDNKGSPQESLNTLKAAADQGFRYITQGNGSGAGLALEDAVSKYNERNPGKEIVYLNYAAVDPSMTNEKCDFWHFRLDADTSMKMEALTSFMKDQPQVKKVYVIGQNYSHGQQVAKYFKEAIHRKRPDVQIVGEDLHPIGQVKDFAPYVAKIKQSGADTIVTGNWGQDLSLLIKAAGDIGYDPRYLNHSGGGAPGTVLAVSQAKSGKLTWVSEWLPNTEDPALSALSARVKQTAAGEYFTPRVLVSVQLVTEAIRRAGSDDPTKVALTLEGMKMKTALGEVTMRKSDHQLLLPQVVSTVAPVDGKTVKVGAEGTQYGFRLNSVTPAQALDLPSACRMKRPTGA